MRILVVFCHPDPESFGAAVCRAFLDGARQGGHEVRLIDLYAEGFQPAMSREEWRGYPRPGSNEDPVREHLDQVRWAEALIFIHPTWWYSQPAMLKGWIDRVLVPHVAFTLPDADKGMRPLLTNIRLVGAVTTLGSPWWWWTFLIGAPGRKILLRGVRACCHPRSRTFFMGLHDMDAVSDDHRRRYLDKVAAKARSLR